MSVSTVPEERAKDEAAGWLVRLKRREVTTADLEAFARWREQPGHKEAYDAAETFWRTTGALEEDPDIQAALDAALSRAAPAGRAGRRSTAVALMAGGGLAAAVLVCAWVYAAAGPRVYATRVGEQRTFSLEDGSLVTLDTNSRLTARLGKTQRRLELARGQALFQVAHDAARPFTVTAGRTSVTALGTRFEVRREAGEAAVILLEGAVDVAGRRDGEPQIWRLRPGERLDTARDRAPERVDVAVATSWTSGRLVFQDMRLAEAVAEFDRYEKRRIELEAGPWFVTSVAQLHDLTVSHPGGGVIRLGRAGPTP